MADRFLQIAALAMCIYGFSGAELGISTAVHTPVLSTPLECARDCNANEPPKYCYYHFTLEYYSVLGGACQLCTPNATNFMWANCQCVQADGVVRGIISINRMLPGPSIQVCENDKVVIDVENRIEGNEATIHWHGILQKGTQYYDGVPWVTQCPIGSGNTMRYQMRADGGTQFYHSHDGLQKVDGVHGAFIVRQPRTVDPNAHLYDYDLSSNVIVLSDWFHEPASEHMPGRMSGALAGQNPVNILVNGKGQFTNPTTGLTTTTPLEVFTVTPGKRYRFRVIAALSAACPTQLSIEAHKLTVIALDGDSVVPRQVDSITVSSGERMDFVMNADQGIDSYWIQVRGMGSCGNTRVQQLSILKYDGSSGEPSSASPTYDAGIPPGIVMSPVDGDCTLLRKDAVCISHMKNAEPINEEIKTMRKEIMRPTPDRKMYVGFNSHTFPNSVIYEPNTYLNFVIPGGGAATSKIINNITYASAPSPLISQYSEIAPGQFCNADNKPASCKDTICTCTHIVDIPLDSINEWILVDEISIANLSHPFHLHGHSFQVIAMGHSPDKNVTKISVKHVKDLDRRGLVKRDRNETHPFKDTLAVPNNGYAIIRFKANNPGFWFFHCHFLFHIASGMSGVMHVGKLSDLPPVPPGFPRCGNHVPSIYV